MLKNKVIVKKLRNIFILIMVMAIIIGIYRNVRNSRAENVIPIELEVSDKNNILESQTVTVEAVETKDGNYLVELPTSVNEYIVSKYYKADDLEIAMNDQETDKTLKLTEDEIANKKLQLQTEYDTKEVSLPENEKVTLYNKELKNSIEKNEETEKGKEQSEDKDVIVTGYMPIDVKLDVTEIDLNSLTSVKLPEENQTMQKAYEVFVYQEVEKQAENTENEENTTNADTNTTEQNTEVNTEENNEIESDEITEETNTTEENNGLNEKENIETEKIKYKPSAYGETLTTKIKNVQEDTTPIVYDLREDNQIVQAVSKVEGEYVETELMTAEEGTKYILATEAKAADDEIIEEDTIQNEENNIADDTTTNASDSISTTAATTVITDIPNQVLKAVTDSEISSGKAGAFLGNTSIQRQNINSVTFNNSISGAGMVGNYSAEGITNRINRTMEKFSR